MLELTICVKSQFSKSAQIFVYIYIYIAIFVLKRMELNLKEICGLNGDVSV